MEGQSFAIGHSDQYYGLESLNFLVGGKKSFCATGPVKWMAYFVKTHPLTSEFGQRFDR